MFSLEKRSPEEFAGERPIMSASTDATSKDFDNDFVSFLEFSKEMFTKYYDPIRKFDFLNWHWIITLKAELSHWNTLTLHHLLTHVSA
jgi:hypothetical protein